MGEQAFFCYKYQFNIMYFARSTVSQDVQTRFPVQLAFAKFLSKIKENFWGSAVSMILELYSKFSFILDRNLAKANCTGNRVCTSCDIVVLGILLLSMTGLPVLFLIGFAAWQVTLLLRPLMPCMATPTWSTCCPDPGPDWHGALTMWGTWGGPMNPNLIECISFAWENYWTLGYLIVSERTEYC